MISVLKRNNVRITGNGDQTLIFAHGFGCDQNVWRHLLKAFESEFKCVVFDHVGAGGSDLSAYNSDKYSSLNGYALDVIEICETLGLHSPTFIGHSVGCMIGVRAALLRPAVFSRLVFVTPSPSYINDGDYIGGMDRENLTDLLKIMDSNYLGWSSMMAPMVMGNPEQPELTNELASSFCSTDPTIAKEFAKVTFLTDSRGDLDQLRIPNLTLQCTDDLLAPLAVGRYIHERTPNNSLVVLNAKGHCPHLSAPDETFNAIYSYLSAALIENLV